MKKLSIISLIALTVILASVAKIEAATSLQFRTLKSSGFISKMASSAITEVIKVKQEKTEEANFFSPKDPCCSRIGAVKTYTIKVVKKNSSSDSFDIRGSIGDSYDKFASRFLNKPINGILTSSFGYRVHPKRKKKHFHSGVDLAAKSGTPIACALSGKVVFAGWKNGYGYVVMVDHGKGYETLYAHCSKLSVSIGQTVNTGKIIAYVGRTGVATGPHLHFEVRKNGIYQNPLKYLKN